MTTTAVDWLARIRALPLPERIKVMNVCGGHERSITTAGLRKAQRRAHSASSSTTHPVPLLPEPRRKSRQRWAIPLLGAASILALLGILAAFTVPAASPVPWVLALGCATAGGYLRGLRGRALIPRRRR